MKVYRVMWRTVCAGLALTGVGMLLIASTASLLCAFWGSSLVTAVLITTLAGEVGKRPLRECVLFVVTSALVGGTAVAAFAGFAIVLGAEAIPLLGVVLVTSPRAVTLYRRLLRSVPTPSAEQLDALAQALAYASPEYVPFQPLTQLRRLTDEQLCQGWRASYLVLQTQPPGAEMIETVEERQQYLDELERRNPGGLTAWLASGARAAGNPLPYLVQHRVGHSAIDWDELTGGQGR